MGVVYPVLFVFPGNYDIHIYFWVLFDIHIYFWVLFEIIELMRAVFKMNNI